MIAQAIAKNCIIENSDLKTRYLIIDLRSTNTTLLMMGRYCTNYTWFFGINVFSLLPICYLVRSITHGGHVKLLWNVFFALFVFETSSSEGKWLKNWEKGFRVLTWARGFEAFFETFFELQSLRQSLGLLGLVDGCCEFAVGWPIAGCCKNCIIF